MLLELLGDDDKWLQNIKCDRLLHVTSDTHDICYDKWHTTQAITSDTHDVCYDNWHTQRLLWQVTHMTSAMTSDTHTASALTSDTHNVCYLDDVIVQIHKSNLDGTSHRSNSDVCHCILEYSDICYI